MQGKSEAYLKWLDVPQDEQPPHHYRLLGIPLYESDLAVIEQAADRQSSRLKRVQTGPQSELSQQLLNEVAAARVCLRDAKAKAAYDGQLAERLRGPAITTPASLPFSAGPSRPVSAARKRKPQVSPVLEIIKIAVGGLSGIFLAVLVLSYFADIDILGWKKSKQVAVKPAGTKNPVPVIPVAETVSRTRPAASPPISRPPPRGVANESPDRLPPSTAAIPPPVAPDRPSSDLSLPSPGKTAGEAVKMVTPTLPAEPVASNVPLPIVHSPPAAPPSVAEAKPRSLADLVTVESNQSAANEAKPAKKPLPAGRRVTKNGYPRIDGEWDEGGRIVEITQKGNLIAIVCEYQDQKDGQIRWEGEGKIDKDGKFAVTIIFVKAPRWWAKQQTRTCQLSDDGDTIDGHASSANRQYNFSLTLVRPAK